MVKLRTSTEALAALKRRADAIAARAGPGHEVQTEITGGGPSRRARAQITAVTRQARRANAEHQALLRALGSARD